MKKIQMEKLKQIKGVTLIALVITIIVLLILAGVSIAMLTGNNGILGKASEAKIKTDKAQIQEKVETVVITIAGYNKSLEEKINILKDKLGITVDSSTDDGNVRFKYEDYNFIANLEDGTAENKGQAEGEKIETIAEAKAETELATENKQVTTEHGTFILPEGYRVTADSADTIKEGVVITDGTSEFVWIPVDNINDMAQVTSGTDANGNTNYQGKLYDFSVDSTTKELKATEKSDYGQETTTYKEPANLSGYDSASNISGWTETMYQEEYNKMVKSVAKYKGFYVGRYESSLNKATQTDAGNSNSESLSLQSKSGVLSATANLSKTNMWYGLYSMSKTYAPENGEKKVVSQMIWGSQYDAMMRWMQKNDINVKENPDDNTPPEKLQNAVRNQTRITGGNNNKDKLNNVYDILGNSFEWTAEAYNTFSRVSRGGGYNGSYSPSYRVDHYPSYTYSDKSSRLTLYIK